MTEATVETLPEAPAPTTPATALEIRLGEAMERIQVDQVTGAPIVKTLADQVALAAWAQRSGLLPDVIKTPGQAWMVMQRGSELGFSGLGAFDFLYVVGGRVRITPDGAKAKGLASGLLVDFREETVGQGAEMMARVTVKRKGIASPIVGEFSVEDAKTAGLWGKSGSRGPSAWVTYPKRMCLARARGFAFGDAFRDLVGGLTVRERYDLDPGERIGTDHPAVEATVVREAAQPPKPPAEDPLDAELAESKPEPVSPQEEAAAPVETLPIEPSPEPVDQAADDEPTEDAPPFQSNAEADRVIAELEAAEAKKATCKHEALAPFLARGSETGRPLLCPECNAEVKPPRRGKAH